MVDEDFRFVSWGDRPYLYNITIGLLEAREYTQEEVDEAIKKARANRTVLKFFPNIKARKCCESQKNPCITTSDSESTF